MSKILDRLLALGDSEIIRIEDMLARPGLTKAERKLMKSRLRKLKIKHLFKKSRGGTNVTRHEDFRKKGMFRETKNSLPGDTA
jgi:hypothetical protein